VLARTNARKINISVTLDPDLLGAIERLAHKEGITLSAMMREILRAEMGRRRLLRGDRRAELRGRVRLSVSKRR
jgi:metal-responsive CopG/Arc/MetJ family transcriptional regulator